jgi:TonB family protein
MQKNILSLAIVLLSLQIAKAERLDTLTAYFKNSGQKVSTKDSADYYRIILPPDTNIDKDLYRVFAYYPNGKLKSTATSLTKEGGLKLDGMCMNYFPNGKRKSTAQFKNGRLVGSQIDYYPNGKIYAILTTQDLPYNYYNRNYNGFALDTRYGYKIQFVELRDSIGNLLVENGNGHFLVFDEDFKTLLREGEIKNNKLEGEWRGAIGDSGRYICSYHKDELKSGISYMKSGNHYTFKQLETKAVFSDGMDGFKLFLKNNVQYPEAARQRKIEGTVVVGFYVETNGTVSGVKIVSGLLKSIDDEALRVINLSPLWVPASKFGIPMRTYYRVDVDFHKN